jgi:CBS domain-containing protein
LLSVDGRLDTGIFSWNRGIGPLEYLDDMRAAVPDEHVELVETVNGRAAGFALGRSGYGFLSTSSLGGPMNRLTEILAEKGDFVLRVDANASVLDAVRRMVDFNVGSLLVTDDGRDIGIVTERDYLRRVTLEGRDERVTQVREIISSPLIVVTPQTTVEECMALMTDRRIRHVPVVGGDGEVVGLVSIGDLVKFRSKQQSFELQYLTEYINSH